MSNDPQFDNADWLILAATALGAILAAWKLCEIVAEVLS